MSALKKTKLTGLTLPPYPREELMLLYEKTLRYLSVLPKDYIYRQAVEASTREKEQIVKENENLEVIENKMNAGQMGELIIQAKKELSLIEALAAARPWEKLTMEAPPHQWTWPPRK